MRTSISSTSGLCLQFHSQAEVDAYHKAEWELQMKFYGLQRAKYGIYSTNRASYVKSRDELTWIDSTWMEDQYEMYLKEGSPE